MSSGLSNVYENSQLEIRQCNTINAMRASEGSDASHEDFYDLSNNVLHVLETQLFL